MATFSRPPSVSSPLEVAVAVSGSVVSSSSETAKKARRAAGERRPPFARSIYRSCAGLVCPQLPKGGGNLSVWATYRGRTALSHRAGRVFRRDMNDFHQVRPRRRARLHSSASISSGPPSQLSTICMLLVQQCKYAPSNVG